ncbi:hypothetical protein Hanom_Chr03g00254321 [Helianthus anomalus]
MFGLSQFTTSVGFDVVLLVVGFCVLNVTLSMMMTYCFSETNLHLYTFRLIACLSLLFNFDFLSVIWPPMTTFFCYQRWFLVSFSAYCVILRRIYFNACVFSCVYHGRLFTMFILVYDVVLRPLLLNIFYLLVIWYAKISFSFICKDNLGN